MANANATPRTTILEVPLGNVAAGSDLTTVLGVVKEDAKVSSVTYIPRTTLTGANTDSRTLSVVNKGAAGSGSTAVATKAYTSGVNATAVIENAVTVSATAADLNVSAGDVLVATSVHVGSTGLADPGGLLRVTLVRR